MITYQYSARNPKTDELVKSKIEAADETAAAKAIRQQGLIPIDIDLEGANSLLGKVGGTHIRSRDKVLFTRQLSTLINAGLPLIQALKSTGNQSASKPLKIVVNSLISDVEGGSSLAGAMQKHPEAFNDVYVSLVAAGEASGTLDKGLERLASQQEKDAEIISKIRGAMVYPIIVIAVMVGVVTFMMVKVIPAVQSLYASLPNVHLPLVTRILISVSNFTVHFWWVVLIVLGTIAFFTNNWVKTIGGKRALDKFKMKSWPFGPLFMKLYMARFARTSSTLIASGVPLLQVMEITAKAVNNTQINDSLTKSITAVKAGKALSDTLEGDPNFLELVPNMIRIGEQSGTIEQMLERVADYYEKEVDNQVKAIETLIEPLLIIVLGVFALIIVAAILLPIYGLAGSSALSSGV